MAEPNGKTCGACGLCCKLLAIEVLHKDAGQWCKDYVRSKGCGIYAERPPPCVSFKCEWLMSRELGDEWRPDRARFLMFYDEQRRRLSVVVDQGSPHAWKREPYYSKIKRLSERTADGEKILICIGDRRIVVFPDQDVDLGVVNPDHKIVSGYARREGQRIPFAMVVSDIEESLLPSGEGGVGGGGDTPSPS